MNTLRAFLAFCIFGAVALCGDEASKYTPESRTTTEMFMTKVLKVYAFQEGDAEYLAYVVNWNGHEVVVVPSGRQETEKYKEGDAIRCGMMQVNQRVGETNRSRINFFVAGSLEPPTKEDLARLDEVAAEVKSRREKRQAAMAGMPNLEAVKRGDATLRFEIRIRANGEVAIDKEVVGDEALSEKLGAVAKENKQRLIYVVVSEKASWEKVTKVMELCRKLGLQKFSMATRPND